MTHFAGINTFLVQQNCMKEMNEYLSNQLENSPIKTTSNG